MRGKLRDKRADTKRDSFKRDLAARRRLPRRDNRVGQHNNWLQPTEEEDENLLDGELEILQEGELQKN